MKRTPPSGSGKSRPERKSESRPPRDGRDAKGKPRFDGEARFKKMYGSSNSGEQSEEKGGARPERPSKAKGGYASDRKVEHKGGYRSKNTGDFRPGSRDEDKGGSRPSRPYKDRDAGFSDRKSGGNYRSKSTGDYRPGSRDEDRSGSRPSRSYKDRDTYSSDRKSGSRGDYRSKAENENIQDGYVERGTELQPMPLNKYIAHSGETSRRDAATLVKQGKVRVNGELILDPGYKVQPTDVVSLAGKKLRLVKHLAYVLLNKPKGYITTTDDPKGRKTVMSLVSLPGGERLFPVGRLDRNTTGLLLMTNDGDLAQKLSHPSFKVKKVYQVSLDKPLTKADFEKILEGVELEDGKAPVDALAYLESKNELGIEIHSGKNRIVRRIFESLGYKVEKLDRVMYAGLTKKNIPRGQWRLLADREIILLRHFKS